MLKRLALGISVLLIAAAGVAAQGTGPAASTSTSEKKTKAPVFRPTKDQIKQSQTLLKEAGLYTGEATGVYNKDTRTGIKGFQKNNGLAQTGGLNRATLEKLNVPLTETQKSIPVDPNSIASAEDEKKPAKTASTSTGPKRPAPFRANKDQISAAQKILRDGKMLTGGEEGKLDDITRDGLGKYQEANGLKVTKTLNAATLEKMGIVLTDKQKEQVAAQAKYDAARAAN